MKLCVEASGRISDEDHDTGLLLRFVCWSEGLMDVLSLNLSGDLSPAVDHRAGGAVHH